MEFTGSLYHPKFVEWDAALEIAPQQDKEKADSGAADERFKNSYLTRYNVSSRFLKDKPFNFALRMNKRREVLTRDFFERQTVESTTYGGQMSLRNALLPMSLSYTNTKQDIERTFRPQQNLDDETLDFFTEPEVKFLGKVRMDYSRNKFRRQETGTTDQEGVSNEVTLFNKKDFNEAGNTNIVSSMRFNALQGTRKSEDISANESLTVTHNKSLRSFYRYNFSDRTSENIGNLRQSFDAGLQHQLYESLFTNFSMRGFLHESSSFDEKSAGAVLNENYKKRIGPALLNLGFDYSYDATNREAIDTLLFIADESKTFSTGTIVTLKELRADIDSIRVTNTAETVTFTRNTDYLVIERSNGQVEIQRLVSGSIANGQTVLVSYIVSQNPDFSFVTTQNSYHLSIGLFDEALRLFYRFKRKRHPHIKGDESTILEDIDDMIIGSEFQNDHYRLRLEYEDFDSTLTPFRALRLLEQARWKISPRGDYNIQASQDFMDLEDGSRKNYEVRNYYSLRLSPSMVFRTEAGFRWQFGQEVDLRSFKSKTVYRVFRGTLYFEMGYEFDREHSRGDEQSDHYFYTKMEREF